MCVARGTRVITRRKAFSTDSDENPNNVYSKDGIILPQSILDIKTTDIGHYLIKRNATKAGYFNLNIDDLPDKHDINGPKALVNKAVKSKGVTINRVTQAQLKPITSDFDKEEKKRLDLVKRQMKRTDCMSSKMNACQAIMKPDSSKSTTNKSAGIKKGLARVLLSCNNDNGPVTNDTWTEFEKGGLILLDQVKFPDVLRLISEFAEVKFKGKNISTRTAYVKFVVKCILTPILTNLPKVRHLIICEEKYSFTPDDFKAATRKSRAKTHQESLAHLQEEHDILSDGKYSQVAIRGSLREKKLVSNFLGLMLQNLISGAIYASMSIVN